MTFYQLYKKLKPYVRPYRWIIGITLFFTALGSFVGQVNAFIMKYTVDGISDYITHQETVRNGFLLLLFVGTAFIGKELIHVFIQIGQKFYGEKLRIFISKDLAQTIINKILTYNVSFFTSDDNQSGKLQTRIDKGVDSLTRLVQNFFIDILPLFATALVALLMMFYSNWIIGVIGLCVIPIYFYASTKQAQRLKGSRQYIKKFREEKSHGIITILESILVIKSFVREDIEEEKQLQLQNNLTFAQISIRKIRTLFEASKDIIEQLGLTLIILITTYFIINGQMTIGAIMFNIMLFNNVAAPIRQFHRIYGEMHDALIYSESYFEILEADSQKEQSGSYIPEKLKGKFEIKNVSFTYPNGTEALKNINITIEPQEITALVGLSGAGKTTIVNLLDRFYEPSSGQILLDGVPLQDYDTHFLRENIGLVLQKNHIFNGSIEENIRYGNPTAPFEEVIDAAKKAHIHEQIMEMPDKYNTKALNLSGGQQQRIAIARLFLKNPPIIFLDEPTASLDAIATEQIKNSIDAIKQNRTVIIISHSISQIIDSDTIYSMNKGRIAECGSHEEIYQMGGTYSQIFDSMVRSLNIEKISQTIKK
ncbi:Xenobiotic-transporting ATPase [Bacteroides coprosuis DSM 18011]|uniref:Xenobiotic-transporting ATPase n=1 Tax=Bacteroides coprosuis DSM 18011 TaxID=679937 RepID=F3ZT46_9BACE|nr:ABC transporter ATP-binding protein [Bacteroides coprosuis]EGJ71008.1 Xenobiotic-transporting ATPase [Bacteroides coprosuis DSM 18011]